MLNGPLVVGATTKHPFYLDDSLLRSGRLSTKIEFDRPNRVERRKLFELYVARITAVEALDLDEAAERSQGVTGADIRALLNSGLALALADGFSGLTSAHLFEALERRGYVRKPEVFDPRELWQRAVHEAGHTFAAFALFGPPSLNRVTLIPRQMGAFLSGGHFEFDEDWTEANPASTTNWPMAAMCAMAGSLAEEIVTGTRRLGPGGGDIDDATDVIMSQLLKGADPDFSPIAAGEIEGRGPYGSEAMRSRLWNLADRHAHELAARTRALLRPQAEAMAKFADVLVPEQALSGDRLLAELRTAGAMELTGVVPL